MSSSSSSEFYASKMPKTAEEAMAMIWDKPMEVREYEREQFRSLVEAGTPVSRAQLSNCYAWTQSKQSVTVVVWLQGSLEETHVEVTEPAHIKVQTEGYPAVIDGDFAYEIDPSQDMDSVAWERLDIICFKIFKKREERWERLFRDGTRGLRAADFPGTEWDDELTLFVEMPKFATRDDVFVDVDSTRLRIECAGCAPFERHFRWASSTATWCFGKGRVEVSIDGDLPTKLEYFKKNGEAASCREDADLQAQVPDYDAARRGMFVEEEDGMLTRIVAEMMAKMDYGERGLPTILSGVAQNMFSYIQRERDLYAFDDTPEASDPETIFDWWNNDQKHLDWCASVGREPPDDDDDDDDEPVVQVLDDDPPPELPLPPGGMLGTAPVKLETAAAPVPRALRRTPLTDYAWDSDNAGKSTVKLYLDFEDNDIRATFGETELTVTSRTQVFTAKLANPINPDASSFKRKKKGTVVLSLKKATPQQPWHSLIRADD
ncbi:hypothetical protein CTAYLR_001640 [Chrysophaeum taylorii]|uniref:CS domain-containing protein n=1 Tax=Chrysophaeum taylorii TaxID=2483200 RepID=A0AAD7XNB2_9STRA|nr:hypothetical protein CTAYLR_001640 [Chrysophaeum taylorii]